MPALVPVSGCLNAGRGVLRRARTLPRCVGAGPQRGAWSARFASTSNIKFSDEVNEALASKTPVVALESTILTHGLPYPTNIEMATEVEAIVRSVGAVPATMAFLDGYARVGLSAADLERLADCTNPQKISRRDIASVIARKQSGGTTIAATMILAQRAGIKVFATGGLGGVHRGVADHWDISADLEELGRTPVAVVCSGPKSILDIPKTLEYLETKGVHVSTFSPDGVAVNVPGFFTPDSGVASPFHFADPVDAARVVQAGQKFGLMSGYVFCVPVEPELAMDQRVVDDAIAFALQEAELQGIVGKATTPFLLRKVWEATGGDSVKTNVEFVKNNALMAAQIARELSILDSPDGKRPFPPPARPPARPPLHIDELKAAAGSIHMPTQLTPQRPAQETLAPAKRTKSDVVVIGALSQDLTCTLSVENISVSSYPGQVSTSLGGTAHNVALAAAYSGSDTRLVSCVGAREKEDLLSMVSPVLDVSGVRVSDKDRTPRYVAMNDAKGELIVACADMDAVAKLDSSYIENQIRWARPKVVVLDGNLGTEQTETVLGAKQLVESDVQVVFEPTSVPKAAKMAEQKHLQVFPNPSIDIATPNYLELMSMYEEFSFRDRFDLDHWFPIIDRLPMSDAPTRMKLDIFTRSHPALGDVIQSGLIQAGIQLLPYIPNLFVTMGANGVLSFQLIEGLRDRTGGVKDGPNSVYLMDRKREFGVLIHHFPVTSEVSDDKAKSVSGIGDTFCGALVSLLARDRMWLKDDGPRKKQAVELAMEAASLSLQTYQTVNSDIADLFVASA